MPPRIILTVPPRIVRQFKAAAKKAWKRETFAFLLGTIVGDHAHIDELYFPDDVEDHCTTGAVNIQDHWYVDAAEQAKELEAAVIGTAHSHPYSKGCGSLRDRAHSETDVDSPVGRMISGICVVKEIRDGGLRASMRFWGPSVAVELRRGD